MPEETGNAACGLHLRCRNHAGPSSRPPGGPYFIGQWWPSPSSGQMDKMVGEPGPVVDIHPQLGDLDARQQASGVIEQYLRLVQYQ
jgi:hypothetical protein